MTDQTEREVRAKVAAEIRNELAARVRSDPPTPLTDEEKQGWRLGMAYAERIARGTAILTPTPHVVTTMEELAEAQSDSDWGYVVVRDAEHRPWVVWDTEHGDFLATSFPTEDDVEHIHGDQHRAVPPIIDARDIPLPATVLTEAPALIAKPAPSSAKAWCKEDREALVEKVARVWLDACGIDPDFEGDDTGETLWQMRAHAASAVLDAIEEVRRG